MFGFLDMMNTYESRKVDNYTGVDKKGNDYCIDTCLVTDASMPYETAIEHPYFNDGEWVIVEQYDTEEEAQKGHDIWVEKFKNQIPKKLLNIRAGFEGILDDEIVTRKNNIKED